MIWLWEYVARTGALEEFGAPVPVTYSFSQSGFVRVQNVVNRTAKWRPALQRKGWLIPID